MTDPEIRLAGICTIGPSTQGGQEVSASSPARKGRWRTVHPGHQENLCPGPIQRRSLVGLQRTGVLSSYGKEQNLNAPTGNMPLSPTPPPSITCWTTRRHVYQLGDATVVCWAKGGGDAYQAFFGGGLCWGRRRRTAPRTSAA